MGLGFGLGVLGVFFGVWLIFRVGCGCFGLGVVWFCLGPVCFCGVLVVAVLRVSLSLGFCGWVSELSCVTWGLACSCLVCACCVGLLLLFVFGDVFFGWSSVVI